MHRIFLGIIVLLMAGCGKPQPPSVAAVASCPPELDAVAAFMRLNYGENASKNMPIVIEDTFSIAMLESSFGSHKRFTEELAKYASADIPAELIRDFCDKNSGEEKVWSDLGKWIPVVLLSRAEKEMLFLEEQKWRADGWERFYAKYPDSPGIITISRVGFSSSGDLAMLYVGCGSGIRSGAGHIRVLRKRDGKWYELNIIIGPAWVS